MVRGLGTFILVATEAAVVAVDDFPEHGCSKLTGADVQVSLDAEVQAATAAAEALCTDPNCTHAYTKIRYQYWDCTHHIDQDTNKEVSEMTIVIQLQLECRH